MKGKVHDVNHRDWAQAIVMDDRSVVLVSRTGRPHRRVANREAAEKIVGAFHEKTQLHDKHRDHNWNREVNFGPRWAEVCKVSEQTYRDEEIRELEGAAKSSEETRRAAELAERRRRLEEQEKAIARQKAERQRLAELADQEAELKRREDALAEAAAELEGGETVPVGRETESGAAAQP